MAEQKTWKFDMGQRVALIDSGEEGVVIARAEYSNSDDNYYVRYCAADGRQTEAWWTGDALDVAEAD